MRPPPTRLASKLNLGREKQTVSPEDPRIQRPVREHTMRERRIRRGIWVVIAIGIFLVVIVAVGICVRGALVKQLLLARGIEKSDSYSGKALSAISTYGDVEKIYYNHASLEQKSRILGWVFVHEVDSSNPDTREWADGFLWRVLKDEGEPFVCRSYAIAILKMTERWGITSYFEGIASQDVQLACQAIASCPTGRGLGFLPLAVARATSPLSFHYSATERDQLQLTLIHKLGFVFFARGLGEQAIDKLGLSNAQDLGAEGRRYEEEGKCVEAMICYNSASRKKHIKHYDSGYALTGDELAVASHRMKNILAQQAPAEFFQTCMSIVARYGLFDGIPPSLYRTPAQGAFEREEWYRAGVWAAAYLLCDPEDESMREVFSTALEHYRGQPLTREELSSFVDSVVQ